MKMPPSIFKIKSFLFDLGLTKEEQHVLLNFKKVEFIPMIEMLGYTRDKRITFPHFSGSSVFLERLVFKFNVFQIDSGIM